MARTFTRDDFERIEEARKMIGELWDGDLISTSTYEQATAEIDDRLSECLADKGEDRE